MPSLRGDGIFYGILQRMRLTVNTYCGGTSPVHACDARVKIVLLAAYSVTLFLVDTWMGLALCALAFALVLKASGIPPRHVFGLVIPVYVLVAFTVAFNSFSLDVGQASAQLGGLADVSAGVLAEAAPVPLVGAFGFVPAGFARGCFFAIRILLLVFASLIVSFSTTSTDLTAALNDFMRPLRRLHVPTDDVAMVFSLALRFIPVTAEEFGRVHDAQWSRGAPFGEGSLWRRLRAWQTVLVPLFVGLFRRADTLAQAMDARCYGAPDVRRTSLSDRRFRAKSAAVLAAGIVLCGVLAVAW